MAGTQPRVGSWGQGVQVFAIVPQQRCAGEECLAPGGSMFLLSLQMWGGKGHLLIGMGKAEWKTRRLSRGGGRGIPPVQTALISPK